MRDNKHILHIEEDAFETPTTVITSDFVWGIIYI